MNPFVNAVSGRDRAVNDIRGSWTTTFRPTVEVLRSFHPEVWPVFVILATCLIMAGLYPFFAASNAMLVFTVGSLGYLVGSRIGQLWVWSGGILVPRYTGSLLALCVWGVALATLLTGLACWSLGNPEPAVAPAMLVGAAMMRRAIRRPVAPWGVAVWWAILAFATLCGAAFDGARQPLVQLAHASSALSHVWIQLGALVGVGLIVPGTRRAMALPTTGIDRVVQSPIGFGSLSREDLRKGVSEAAYALGMLVLMWYFFPRTAGEFVFMLLWFGTLGGAVCNWWESTVHVQLSRDWIFGVAQDRKELGRRAAARVVWMSLPWLVLGTGWSAIHAFARAPAEGLLLDEVLIVHSSALLSATSLCLVTGRLPPSVPYRRWAGLLLMGLGAGVCGYFTFFEYHAWDYAVLVLALIGTAVLTVFLGGRALARAEILTEIPVPPRGSVR